MNTRFASLVSISSVFALSVACSDKGEEGGQTASEGQRTLRAEFTGMAVVMSAVTVTAMGISAATGTQAAMVRTELGPLSTRSSTRTLMMRETTTQSRCSPPTATAYPSSWGRAVLRWAPQGLTTLIGTASPTIGRGSDRQNP